jgi:hypothetical protein
LSYLVVECRELASRIASRSLSASFAIEIANAINRPVPRVISWQAIGHRRRHWQEPSIGASTAPPRRVSGHQQRTFPGILRASIRVDSHPVQIQSATSHRHRVQIVPSVPSPSPSPPIHEQLAWVVSSSARATSSCASLACIFLRTVIAILFVRPTETLSWGIASCWSGLAVMVFVVVHIAIVVHSRVS